MRSLQARRSHRYTRTMSQTVAATAPGIAFSVELDFASMTWSSATQAPPEGVFPLVAEAGQKRFEVYSDGTFAEVEP